MKKTILFVFILFFWSVLFSQEPDLNVQKVVRGNNSFGITLYHLINQKNRNFVFSPFSITSAMAMMYTGAKSDTREEIKTSFDFPEDNQDIYSEFSRINSRYKELNRSGEIELIYANSIWFEQTYQFLPGFTSPLSQYFFAESRGVDFKENPAAATQEINQWVADNTKNKIPNIITDSLPQDTRLALVNALYFNGKWLEKFEKQNTRERKFWITPDQSVIAKFMNSYHPARYASTRHFQVLEMRYSGQGDFSMFILLPVKKNGLLEAEKELSPDNLNTWFSSIEMKWIKISIPKFRIRTGYSLNTYLQQMGIHQAFLWPGADFSGIDGSRFLVIGSVLHQAFIDVDEAGTEAAAATVIPGMLGSPGGFGDYILFQADHPFIYLIRDNKTGMILFLGRLMDPTKQ